MPSWIPAFEMPTRNTNPYLKPKSVPRSYPNNKGTIMRACLLLNRRRFGRGWPSDISPIDTQVHKMEYARKKSEE